MSDAAAGDGDFWHCKACGRLFPVELDRVRGTCIDCGRGPIVKASELHARLARECGAERVSVYSSKKG